MPDKKPGDSPLRAVLKLFGQAAQAAYAQAIADGLDTPVVLLLDPRDPEGRAGIEAVPEAVGNVALIEQHCPPGAVPMYIRVIPRTAAEHVFGVRAWTNPAFFRTPRPGFFHVIAVADGAVMGAHMKAAARPPDALTRTMNAENN